MVCFAKCKAAWIFREKCMKKNKSGNQAAGGLVKYIRIRSESGARFVAFDFTKKNPTLYVE